MKQLILFTLFLFNVSFFCAQELVQDNSKTKITFKIKNFGSYVNGSFSGVTIKSNFNTKDLTKSFLNASIDVNTIDTNNKSRNKSLSEDKYFDVVKYPKITLTSKSIKLVSENNFTLTADLTVKATTKTITIPLTVIEKDSEITINADFEINRRDYTVGKSSWVMSDDVKIKVVYVAKK